MKLIDSNMNSKYQGFTLVELLLTIAVLGVVSLVVLAAIDPGSRLAQARDSQRKAELRQMANALDAYYVDHEVYPMASDSEAGNRVCGQMNDADEYLCGSAVADSWHTAGLTAALDVLLEEDYVKTLSEDLINDVYVSVFQPDGHTFFYLTSPVSGGIPGQYYMLGAFLENEADPLTLSNLGGAPNVRPKWPDCTTDIGFSGNIYLIRSYSCPNDPEGSL